MYKFKLNEWVHTYSTPSIAVVYMVFLSSQQFPGCCFNWILFYLSD